jgi:hypothetical protein
VLKWVLSLLLPVMRAIISVFKTEFEGKEHIAPGLKELIEEVKLVSGAYILSPKAGKLFSLLNVLKDNKINYGTHYDTTSGAQMVSDSDEIFK